MAFRILSIDGGGLRGLIPIQVLKEIEKRTGRPIFESFDLFAGTSTGGLLVTALTMSENIRTAKPKYSLDDIEAMYQEMSRTIFPRSGSDFLNNFNKEWLNLFKTRFNDGGINRAFRKYLQDYRLSNCIKPILIATYDTTRHRPIFFKSRYINPSSSGYDVNKNAKLYDICRATSAGPTYLPSYCFEYSDEANYQFSPNCIDGGVFINNPAIGALVEILKHKGDVVYGERTKLRNKDIFLLSLGTGSSSGNQENTIDINKGRKWGILKWGRPLIDIMMNGNSQAVDYQMRELLPSGNYHRIQVSIKNEFSDMADSSPETLKYWIAKINEFLNDSAQLNELQRFIDRAKL